MTRKPPRQAPISYRPPQGLRDEFRTRVQTSGLSTNAYITAAVFGHAPPRSARRSALDQKMTAMLLSQAARISDRLDEAARQTGGAGATPLLSECRDALAEIRTCLMLALGRDG
ncbi:hypothetical protein ABH944_005432 [Caballeronia udeis]|uniref:Mobilization protein n=1 Tax=Caballeronia udeis TaxID=1232866 RepID=A0ABW8MNG0_9BURK